MTAFLSINHDRPWAMDSLTTELRDEASRDPGTQSTLQGFNETDFQGHRAHTFYVGVHVPTGRRRSHHRRHRHHHKRDSDEGDGDDEDMPPSQRVRFLLGEDGPVKDDEEFHESHPLFSEMEELSYNSQGELEWRETARWIKFEEDVEEGGSRWSKPHVSTLSLHSLFELRSFLLNGTVLLDLAASNLGEIVDLALDQMVASGLLHHLAKEQVRDMLLKRHRHLYQKNKENSAAKLPIIRSLADIGRSYSTKSTSVGENRRQHMHSHHPPNIIEATPCSSLLQSSDQKGPYLAIPGNNGGNMAVSPSGASIGRNASGAELDVHKGNTNFLRKIPPGAEASNVLVGEVPFLEKPISAFIRLAAPANLGDLTEVPVPTRFIFFLLGPVGGLSSYHEIGRAVATVLTDEIFHEVAYRAKNRNHLLTGIDEFLDSVTVLPPGEWDPNIRIEPPAAIPSQQQRRNKEKFVEEVNEEHEEEKVRERSGLVRSGKLFGGLINDLKRKKPWYFSDFKDAFSLQCIAAFTFLYFACLTPIVTFGGLLSDATGRRLGTIESLCSGFVCGIIYGFFSGQPLTILGSTGPVLVFETIVYDFSTGYGLDYLALRLWIGVWIGVILMILVAVDASAFVCYITRFTEENFSLLIATIFIYNAIAKLFKIGLKYPLDPPLVENCTCTPNNYTEMDRSWTDVMDLQNCTAFNGTLVGPDCDKLTWYPNVFLMSVLLCFTTYILCVSLKGMKTSSFFPAKVRQLISDFGVFGSILSMTCIDYFSGVHTPKLEVPSEFSPTWEGRGWLIDPFTNPMWTIPAAILPALLACILIFMDQQITAVIINRRENKLKKGCGYHLDLFVLSILIIINSFLGLPWFVAATVLSINHVNALKLETECAAPGEKPQFLGVREQRVTHILIFLMVGLSVFLTPVLQYIPMPVLYGVFLFMGTSPLDDMQFYERIKIMFMPNKYQPDRIYLRKVSLRRVHLFTFIQLVCFVLLWVVKTIDAISISFPLMLVVMIAVRKMLDLVFTQYELKALDDALPDSTKKKKELLRLAEEGVDGETEESKFLPQNSSGRIHIELPNGNIMTVPQQKMNISKEVKNSGVWKNVNSSNQLKLEQENETRRRK
ncbi:sodium bicarbonate cotransporter 3-like isoform X3 [Artemia franciscana]